MADIFLSYAREDAARAQQVAKGLEAAGYDVFWDTEIPPGTTWADYLESKLSQSKALVVLWSAASTQSQWVREEARMGRDRGKLLPVMLDGSPPPFGFGEVQAADLSQWAGGQDDAAWRRLLTGLESILKKSGEAAPTPRKVAPQSGWKDNANTGFAARAETAMLGGVAEKKGMPGWMKWVVGGLAGLGALALIGLVVGGDDGAAPPGPIPDPAQFGSLNADLSPAVQAQVTLARTNAEAAKSASETAMANAQTGAQAVAAAASGQMGFGSQQMPDGSMIAGNLAALQAGQRAPVGIQNQQGLQFAGLFQGSPSGYTIDGSASWGTLSAAGEWSYNGPSYDFVGTAAINGKFQLSTRESGSSTSAEGMGVGIVTYPDGRSYAGEYRTAGQGPQAQLFMNGLGALYAANGDLIQAGRWNNDRYVGPE
jgi:hypothetical protein